eukprot:5077599-Amphidinium_carterae.1
MVENFGTFLSFGSNGMKASGCQFCHLLGSFVLELPHCPKLLRASQLAVSTGLRFKSKLRQQGMRTTVEAPHRGLSIMLSWPSCGKEVVFARLDKTRMVSVPLKFGRLTNGYGTYGRWGPQRSPGHL